MRPSPVSRPATATGGNGHERDGTAAATSSGTARRRSWRLVVVVAVLLSLPLPWRFVMPEEPQGLVLPLDGRLEVDGATVDPPGRWSWLVTLGRPQLLGEVVHDRLRGRDDRRLDVWSGSATRQPALSEPAAGAVGLRHAGHDIPLGLLVEARQPLLDGYPDVAVVTAVDGVALTDRRAWNRVSARWEAAHAAPVDDGRAPQDGGEQVTFELADGRIFTAPGPGLPYAVVNVMDLAPPELQVGVTFRLARVLPWDWLRDLSIGSSHGLMVALTTYAQASGEDLARGRHIAGTGGIRGDGTVTPIGGVRAKALAANHARVDVLLVPASQVDQLEGLTLPGTKVVPVETLQDAIDRLAAPR